MQYKPNEVEKEILEFWEKNKILDKLRKKNAGKKPWSFIDGPITANNPMGVHHAWGRTYKDLYIRFKAMQGFDQRYQNGFDCQGLWLEVETEKQLKFNSKKDIENFGLDKFSKACRQRVEKFSKIQTDQSIKLGQWMDWDNSYYTMSDKNIEYIWFFLKKCHEKGWLYKGTRVLPWCIRCGTSSSQHEMADGGYEELTHPSIYVKAKIKGRKNEYLLIWTTTEWTLSSNVAAAVNPELNYSQVKKGSDILYVSESALKKIGHDYIVLDTIKGIDLVGLEYESFYPDFEVQKNIKHKVVPWSDVSAEDGTGIVHIAPTCGEEDYELGKTEGLSIIAPALDENGNYLNGFGWQTGKNVANIKQEIIKELDKRKILHKVEDYTHRYPVCWRCKEPLVFRMDSSWFISCEEIRPIMKNLASKVFWSPEHVEKLMQDWLDNMGDWNISRKRYWGLPLMFFECSCKHLEVIGSVKELKEKASNPEAVDSLPELHRPWIDEIKIKCTKCKKEIERIKEIGDCWLDAGIVPFSTLNYLEDKKYWNKWFPAELIIEMRAQTRLWFYSLLFMSATLENKSPYKSVFAYEEVKDEKGETMHKSKGNAIWFDEAVEKMGADVMRWLYTVQNPKLPLRFGYTPANEVKRYLEIIWNLGVYVKQNCVNKKENLNNLTSISRWIISKRESLKSFVTENLEKLQPNLAMAAVKDFLLVDLSRTYVQFIRDSLNDSNIQAVLYNSYLDALKLLGPFTPFAAEKIYMDICNEKESLFLEDWPKPEPTLIDKDLESNMNLVLEVIQEISAKREEAKINVRWPLAKAEINVENTDSLKEFIEAIKKYTNIKNLEIKEGKLSVKLDTKLTKELELEGYSRELTRFIQESRKKAGLNKQDKIKININSKYDLSKMKNEIMEKVNAVSLGFNKKDYNNNSKQKIKDYDFEVSFEKV